MKKAFRIVLVLALAVLCLTAVAAAADTPASGLCDPTVESAYASRVTLTAQKADGTPVSTPTTQEGKAVYADAVKVELTCTGADTAAQYLVYVVTGESATPTESNMKFIDQTGGTGTATFTIYPQTLENGATYSIYLASSSSTDAVKEAVKVGSFGYYAAYKLGDVNEDGVIDAFDAMAVINHVLENEALTGNKLLAANVDTNNPEIDAFDAMKIINYVLENITEF